MKETNYRKVEGYLKMQKKRDKNRGRNGWSHKDKENQRQIREKGTQRDNMGEKKEKQRKERARRRKAKQSETERHILSLFPAAAPESI